jgi:hypothetical protein
VYMPGQGHGGPRRGPAICLGCTSPGCTQRIGWRPLPPPPPMPPPHPTPPHPTPPASSPLLWWRSGGG